MECSYAVGVGRVLELLSGPKVSQSYGPGALAWSESTTAEELKWLCGELAERQWIRSTNHPSHPSFSVVVTSQGYEQLHKPTVLTSDEGFVAMWLDESMDAVYEQAIKPGIENAGYKAVRIDREQNVDKIDDAIMAKIRESRFVLADFTHGDDGIRGSVYFEAGFARGLGIEVISTCRADKIDALHFDTRQYYHIAWTDDEHDKLRQDIEDRIGARIGAGESQPTRSTAARTARTSPTGSS